LLVRCGPAEVADAWCASRLGGDWAGTFGTMSRDVPYTKILSRGFPSG
jgi:putative acyl-CoA dehydrogenase